ncbi:alcohol dehydrogenase [Rhodococcus sp. 06-418-5]|uniref:zinc-dependent alcohol dehydrogenase n=1 Tax=unclassified Rhodococcus (in: high G+C Gram-positive bacteria) TaxID=192944 RepID=UPI000B9A3E30|nr:MULTISPECIES: zinc-binding dehydrogenase [unclassified Rhodococcus (in: high G+C Gram-positive bacteria)]OZC63284.1 alcohol dehydrogenase [Rhodococcus sp. 06-470-2]OZC79022.1 alcohol dehydrogenase [Rhodococcus sp. 06-418-5]OZC89833.1 alcohol dehydrogenase [Rhodococcus sp. 06-412-2C]OZC93297.1 alcohol dehydrogenase [Rhodococcus sp. 06-412-2B]OZE05124.1 alcohol dehydrogenase [Rhodococcus sp. 05-2255-3C]
MKALRFVGENRAEVADLDIPTIAADEVLIAARSVGVCHSDIELLEGRYIIPFEYPIIPGHEWSGEVAKVGADVDGFQVGDRVVGECVIGDDHFGFSISGAAAEFFVVKPAWLHKLPDEVSFTSGALVEPFSCGYYGLMRAGNVNASDVLVVLGAGPIGLGVVAGGAALGATTIVVEPSEGRRQAALKLGAAHAVTPEEVDELLDRVSGGRGADVVVEATGRPEVMASALELAGHRARVVYIGIDVGRSAPAKLGLIQSKELDIRGAIGSPGVWPATLRFIARSGLDLGGLVTREIAADDAVTALDEAQKPAENIKVHITFDASL